MPEVGVHNRDLDTSVDRLEKAKSYRDLSTIIICPTRGVIPARVVQSWLGLMRPMNQKVIGPIFAVGMEVGQAYSSLIEQILANPDLSQYKYILTIEEDNMPPADGLLKLYESMDQYDVVQGLYWTKGEGGQPMIYGDPKVMPKNFIPQIPRVGEVQHCNGLGMGFNLFKLDIFKNPNLTKPWFKTVQEVIPGVGARAYTQDLYFYELASKEGYKFAVDNRVKVGHYDLVNDIVW
ncbi:MAG: hypothetical protein IMZ64_12040 [Bacteroidetes bacterium]|nr:hypothetical protein [Bacteroidota bacterium]